MFKTKIGITVLKEFEDNLSRLINRSNVKIGTQLNRLSLEDNALLAAFSVEAALNANKYRDISFEANGLFCDLIMTYEGVPQFFLNDKYGVKDAFAVYHADGEGIISPIIKYKKLFDRFLDMELMTGVKEN